MKVGILGDGLISLALAKTLVNEGIPVDLIYNYKSKNINKNRTIGITKTNIDFFNKEVLDISKLLWEVNKIEIFNEKSKKKILNFENNKNYLFSIIKNYKLYNLLINSLKNNKLFKKKNIPHLKILNKNIYQVIINCDSNSLITKKFFFKNIKKNYESNAYVTILNHKKNIQNNIAYQVFTRFGPIAFLPISEIETSVVFSVKKDKNLNQTEIINLIKKYNFKYAIKNIEKIENFELISSNLRSYYYKNILAFGELLHKIHPLAGQGFNMSIRDIKKLHQLVKNRINLGLEINSSICLDFEKQFKYKNYLFSSGIDFIYEFFNLESNIKNNQLGKTIKLLGKNKSFINFLTKLADNGI